MTNLELGDQSIRLLGIATEWFERAIGARDEQTALVAGLAHEMCRAAHQNLAKMFEDKNNKLGTA